MEIIEIWKDIPNYEGIYQVSNLGRVKSLQRLVKGKINLRINKEKILKPTVDFHGYCVVGLYNLNCKRIKVHQLVAIAFLNHKLCGHKLVVNHIDGNKINNNLKNLEIVTQRENANLKRFKSTSQYVGVNLHKNSSKWVSKIWLNGTRKHLGYFINEYDAHLAYEKALHNL
jgi:hypothetical protein